jgi:hypothetical protein
MVPPKKDMVEKILKKTEEQLLHDLQQFQFQMDLTGTPFSKN